MESFPQALLACVYVAEPKQQFQHWPPWASVDGQAPPVEPQLLLHVWLWWVEGEMGHSEACACCPLDFATERSLWWFMYISFPCYRHVGIEICPWEFSQNDIYSKQVALPTSTWLLFALKKDFTPRMCAWLFLSTSKKKQINKFDFNYEIELNQMKC